ncbi:uncharacterized protein PAC_17783 [Phialocephala subalpina]|uniref:C2H2-type domain-containing protein n=1 Tax=Phialocephala subalpina TaxID=576137 RepID=A0A1L7XS61_9HELO|nr:uncharacterized protein PAC_17783 [Phialocephala subalpina]
MGVRCCGSVVEQLVGKFWEEGRDKGVDGVPKSSCDDGSVRRRKGKRKRDGKRRRRGVWSRREVSGGLGCEEGVGRSWSSGNWRSREPSRRELVVGEVTGGNEENLGGDIEIEREGSLITSFSLDSAPSNSTLLKCKGYCDIGFEVAQLDISNYSLPRIQNRRQGSIGENNLILGFPIRRRPEGYPGLEVTFNTLLYSLQATRAILLKGQVVIKGRERRLKLVKRKDDVFLWHLLHPLADDCSCWVDRYDKVYVSKTYDPLHRHGLEAGRHILSTCANDYVSAEDTDWVSEKPHLIGTKNVLSRSLTARNPDDGPEIPPHNIIPNRNKGRLHRLLSEFRSYTQSQSFASDGGRNSGPLADTAESSHIGNASGHRRKRKLEQRKGDDSGEDDFLPPTPKRAKSGQGKRPQKSFACPYLKWDPITHRRCCENKLSAICAVKQHLTRKHTPVWYCQSCQAIFTDDISLQRHIDIGKCSRRDPSILNGISSQKHMQLTRKSKPKASEVDQWFAIWEILFGQHPRPRSVYIDDDLNLEMLQFQEYCYSRGPAILREHIESDPVWVRPETTEEQRRVYLDRVIAQGINSLFDDWRSSDSSPLRSPERHPTSLQRSGYETPTSSMVDSGVAIGSQSSFRESGSQRSELPVNFGIQAGQFSFRPAAASNLMRSPPIMQEGMVALPQTQVQNLPSAFFDPIIEGSRVWNWGDQGDGVERGFHAALDPETSNVDTLQGFGDILAPFSEPLPSASLNPVGADLNWNWGDQNNHFGTGFHTALEPESNVNGLQGLGDLSSYFSRSNQGDVTGGQSAEMDQYL